ncbi:hypothetical protein [Rhizorhabdus dicambivorans]|nr:hypothetical protein [Rhizorhabdus dicambivorans]
MGMIVLGFVLAAGLAASSIASVTAISCEGDFVKSGTSSGTKVTRQTRTYILDGGQKKVFLYADGEKIDVCAQIARCGMSYGETEISFVATDDAGFMNVFRIDRLGGTMKYDLLQTTGSMSLTFTFDGVCKPTTIRKPAPGKTPLF